MARHDRIIKTTTDTPIEAPVAAMQPEPEVPAAPAKNRRKRAILGAVGICVLVAAGFFGREYWTVGRFMVDTNDAYVTADVTLISSRVQGYVAQVPVAENAVVRAGEVLVRLDDGDYVIALHTAQSRVATADNTLARIDAQSRAAEAGVAQAKALQQMAEAQLRTAQSNSDRVHQLASKNVAAQAQLDAAVEGLDTAKASVASATADKRTARTAL